METTQNQRETRHKFDQPLKRPLTYRERVELQYASNFIPFLKVLEKVIGHEQVLQCLQEYAFQVAAAEAEEVVKAAGKNDLSLFKDLYSPADPVTNEVLIWEVLESTEETFVVNVTECLLAEVFRKAGAAEYGCAAICCDVLFTRLVNPQIGLDLEGTLMEGYPSCLHRWYVRR